MKALKIFSFVLAILFLGGCQEKVFENVETNTYDITASNKKIICFDDSQYVLRNACWIDNEKIALFADSFENKKGKIYLYNTNNKYQKNIVIENASFSPMDDCFFYDSSIIYQNTKTIVQTDGELNAATLTETESGYQQLYSPNLQMVFESNGSRSSIKYKDSDEMVYQTDAVGRPSWSKDSTRLSITTEEGNITFIDISKPDEAVQIRAGVEYVIPKGWVSEPSVYFSDESDYAVLYFPCDDSYEVLRVDLKTMKVDKIVRETMKILDFYEEYMVYFYKGENNKEAFDGTKRVQVIKYNLQTGAKETLFEASNQVEIYFGRLSPDEKQLAVGFEVSDNPNQYLCFVDISAEN